MSRHDWHVVWKEDRRACFKQGCGYVWSLPGPGSESDPDPERVRPPKRIRIRTSRKKNPDSDRSNFIPIKIWVDPVPDIPAWRNYRIRIRPWKKTGTDPQKNRIRHSRNFFFPDSTSQKNTRSGSDPQKTPGSVSGSQLWKFTKLVRPHSKEYLRGNTTTVFRTFKRQTFVPEESLRVFGLALMRCCAVCPKSLHPFFIVFLGLKVPVYIIRLYIIGGLTVEWKSRGYRLSCYVN